MLAGEPDLEVIGEAQNGQEAIESCCRLCPKLVLMGVGMPKMEGIEATRAIKTECPATSVLILAAHKNPDHFLHAVRAGAAGYVLKDATNHQLMSAVRKVLVGEFPLNQELAMRLLRRLSTEEKTDGHTKPSIPEPPSRRREEPLPHSPTDSLTDREIEVLRLLALGKTNREVAQDLWVSLSTVKFHVHRLFGKLGVSDRTQAAVRAVELGLLADQEEEGYP